MQLSSKVILFAREALRSQWFPFPRLTLEPIWPPKSRVWDGNGHPSPTCLSVLDPELGRKPIRFKRKMENNRDGYGDGEEWPSPTQTLDWGGEIRARRPNNFDPKGLNCIFTEL